MFIYLNKSKRRMSLKDLRGFVIKIMQSNIPKDKKVTKRGKKVKLIVFVICNVVKKESNVRLVMISKEE